MRKRPTCLSSWSALATTEISLAKFLTLRRILKIWIQWSASIRTRKSKSTCRMWEKMQACLSANWKSPTKCWKTWHLRKLRSWTSSVRQRQRVSHAICSTSTSFSQCLSLGKVCRMTCSKSGSSSSGHSTYSRASTEIIYCPWSPILTFDLSARVSSFSAKGTSQRGLYWSRTGVQ